MAKQQIRLEAALEQLTQDMGWLILGNCHGQNVVPCARRSTAGQYDVSLIAPELMKELESHLLSEEDWSDDGSYSESLLCNPDILSEMGISVPTFRGLKLAAAAKLMSVWDHKICLVCHNRFAGAAVDGVCLRCYTKFEGVSPEDPCVVCQVENKESMHGRLVVECKQCRKHTCLQCRKKQWDVGKKYDCPACRRPHGILVANEDSVRLCWYAGAK